MAFKKSSKGSRERFVYKRRDEETVKKRAKESGRGYETGFKNGFDVFTAEGGTNTLRVLPPTWPNAEHYALSVFVHSYVGAENSTFICPAKNDHIPGFKKGPCPCCEAWREAKDNGDDEEAKAMSYSERAVSWAIDREGDEDQPILVYMSRTRDNELIDLATDERTGKLVWIDDPDEGYDFSFKRTGKRLTTKYTGTRIARDPSPINDDEKIQEAVLQFINENPIPSVLMIRDYDFIDSAISGKAAAKDEDLDDEDENQKDRSPRRRSSHEEEEKDESPRSRRGKKDEDEDEEEAPRRRSSRNEEETDEDDEPKPRRGKKNEEEEDEDDDAPKSRRKDDDEEEDEDDKPHGRRNKKDDDEEETDEDDEPKPRRGKKNEEEEDEDNDAPKSRRRSSHDDEDEEETPRKRGAAKKKPISRRGHR